MRRLKSLLSILLAAAMLLGLLPMAVLADEDETAQYPYTYESDNEDYVAYKVSHPDSPTNRLGTGDRYADGIVDYVGSGVVAADDQGQGDRAQNYSWSAIQYGDWVYVGTCQNAMLSTLRLMGTALGHEFSEEQLFAVADVMYNGDFFLGEEDGGNAGGILVKVNVKTGETVLISSKSSSGFNMGLRNACEYEGKLYFCGSINGLPSILQVDPETDESRIIYQGMTQQEYYQGYLQNICSGIRGLCEFDGELIISCVIRDKESGTILPLILSSDHPWDGQDAFTQIANYSDLYEYPAFHFEDSIYGGSIWEMVEFNGSMYVSICTGTPDNMPDENTMQSFAIVRGDKAADGTWTWTPVVGDKADGAKYTFGIDPERTRAGAGVLQVYNDYLYIGEYNDEEIAMENILFDLDFTFMNKNFDESVRLYRMDKDENIELVVGDSSKMFPKGSLSGLGSGFGHNENQYIWRMNVCDGKLYVGTFDTSSLLEPLGQFANYDLFKMSKAEWVRLLGFVRQLISMSAPENDGTKAADTDSLASIRELFDRFDDKTLADMFFSASSGSTTISSFVENTNKYALGHDFIKNTIVKMKDFVGTVRELSEKIVELLKNARYLGKATRGFDMYVSEDGVNFTAITIDGFGDPFNHGLRVFANTDAGMCIGTANPFWGSQIWKIEDVSGTEKPETKPGCIFTDVLENSYYFDAVKWAVGKSITKGTDDTHFSPNSTCTRAQAVTLLWRAAGSPAPESSTMPFTDVAENTYYYNAVLWAVEKGITMGTTKTTFSPNECCNRGQIVSFLWRAAGSPTPESSTMPFTDVADNAYYYNAVLWAVNNGITKGTTETTFSSGAACTRAQIVSFLYRAET